MFQIAALHNVLSMLVVSDIPAGIFSFACTLQACGLAMSDFLTSIAPVIIFGSRQRCSEDSCLKFPVLP